ncbi:MAG: hypothetical protein CVU43_00750 [Chloroflexi bacterium HGW-Chloroflexi-5]|jgi:integrase|nr:MAG: hypothetical protein CVU43_00750 [Chloroflexi bacterium HGW-Chloroflexi-5]
MQDRLSLIVMKGVKEMAKKHRGRNEGSIFQLRNKKWRAQVYSKGNRLSKNTETKSEALEWIRNTQTQINKGYDIKGSSVTLKEYLPSWLEKHRLSIKPRTAYSYASVINNHIIPLIGDRKLRDLRLLEIENFYSSLLDKGIGPRTVKIVHNILHTSLNKALKYGLVIFNPTHGASLPKYHHDEMVVLDTYQVGEFLIAAQTSPSYALFYTAITTGMRMGELFGLKWSDLQWIAGVLLVQRQMQYVPGQGRGFTETKTLAGNRSIKLGEGSLDVLRRHKANQLILKEKNGLHWHDQDLIFPNSVGRPGDASNIRIEFNRILNLAALPKMRFHDLRHTAASLLLNSGVPVIVVSNMLGHSKPSVTLDIYAHVFHDSQREAAIVMDRLVTPIRVEIPLTKQLVKK